MDPAVIAALDNGYIGHIRFMLALYLDSGTLFYTTHSDSIDYNGDTYTPLGAIGSFSGFKETKELEPADYDIKIGTADPVILALFGNEPLINRKCSIAQVLLDDAYSIVGDISKVSGILQPASISFGRNPTISIPVRDQLADWDRNISVLYTDAEQKRRDSSDNCLEHVSEIARRDIIWPAASYYD